LLLKNNDDNPHELSKNNGLGAIRTPDLRRVKAHCTLGSEASGSSPCCFLSHEWVGLSHNGLAELDLKFTLEELNSYVEY